MGYGRLQMVRLCRAGWPKSELLLTLSMPGSATERYFGRHSCLSISTPDWPAPTASLYRLQVPHEGHEESMKKRSYRDCKRGLRRAIAGDEKEPFRRSSLCLKHAWLRAKFEYGSCFKRHAPPKRETGIGSRRG